MNDPHQAWRYEVVTLLREIRDRLSPIPIDVRALANVALDEVVAAAKERPAPENKVTRFEVIDETGRRFTRWNTSIQLSYQDDGRTLKVFVAPDAAAGVVPPAPPATV
jgi:hypothetical protein